MITIFKKSQVYLDDMGNKSYSKRVKFNPNPINGTIAILKPKLKAIHSIFNKTNNNT